MKGGTSTPRASTSSVGSLLSFSTRLASRRSSPDHPTGTPGSTVRGSAVACQRRVLLPIICGAFIFVLSRHRVAVSDSAGGAATAKLAAVAGRRLVTFSSEPIHLMKGKGGKDAEALAHTSVVPEVWARQPANPNSSAVQQLLGLLGPELARNLSSLCGRCLYRTLSKYVKTYDFGAITLVATGDIPAMWIRDSAVQMATYLPRVHKRPALRRVVEGTIRAQAFFVLQDEYANAFNLSWTHTTRLPKFDRQLGRGGWVWTRNFELDSVGYFFNLLWNWFATPAVWAPEQLLGEAMVHDAVLTTLRMLWVEQEHQQRSTYRYSELEREGLGPPCNVTGMVWSAFRPSDDMQKYSYSIPDNMYVAGALERLLLINQRVWRDPEVERLASQISKDIVRGINEFGTHEVLVEDQPGGGLVKRLVYAYEVDGLGNQLVDFDDPNVPSLLAIPLLGYRHYNPQIYTTTRRRILSKANKFYFSSSKLQGLGSPHTFSGFVWPLATAVQALTTTDPAEQAGLLVDLLHMATVNGLMHESVSVTNMEIITRLEFGWANALTVVAVEQLLGVDCDDVAETAHRRMHQDVERMEYARAGLPVNNVTDDHGLFYEKLQANVANVVPCLDPVEEGVKVANQI